MGNALRKSLRHLKNDHTDDYQLTDDPSESTLVGKVVEVVNPADGDQRLPDEEHVPHHAVGNHAHRRDGSLLRRAVPEDLYFLTSHRGLFSSKSF